MTGSMSVTMLQVSANAQANKLVSVAESQIDTRHFQMALPNMVPGTVFLKVHGVLCSYHGVQIRPVFQQA